MSDAEVRAAADIARQMIEHLDECNRIGKFSSIEEAHIRQIAEALVSIAAEARSHDGEWEAMRERCAKACESELRLGYDLADLTGFVGENNALRRAANRIRSLSAVPLFDEGRL